MTSTPGAATGRPLIEFLPEYLEQHMSAALTRVAKARARLDAGRDAYYAAIVDAVNRGASVADVARAAGLTRQAVYDIVRHAT